MPSSVKEVIEHIDGFFNLICFLEKNEIYSFIPVENLFWVEKKYYVKKHP